MKSLPSESQSVLAVEKTGNRLIDCTAGEMINLVRFLYNELSIKAVFTTQEERDDFVMQTQMLSTWIQATYPLKTIEEVKLAFNLYITGKLDIKFIRLIDKPQVGQVMASYERYRQNTIKSEDLNQQEEDTKKGVTPIESTVRLLWEKVKSGKDARDYGQVVWNWLIDNDKLTITQEEYDQFIVQAKNKYIEEKTELAKSKGYLTVDKYLKSLSVGYDEKKAIKNITDNLAVIFELSKIKDIDEFLRYNALKNG